MKSTPIMMGNNDRTLLCPCCRTELVEDGLKHLETLVEHVSDPNRTPSLKMSYRCPAGEGCPASMNGIIWNEYGERYERYGDRLFSEDIQWINNNDAPFGTIHRKINVEVSKQDENHDLFKFPCYPLKGWICRVKYLYKSNDNGDILSRKRKLEWLRPDDGRYVYHIWGYRSFLFGLKQIRRHRRAIKSKNPQRVRFGVDNLKENVRQMNWADAQWWRKINGWISKQILKKHDIEVG